MSEFKFFMSPIMLWSNPKKTGLVFLPTLLGLLAVSYYSIISVISISSLLLLLSISLSKFYTHVMVNLLAKLPADHSSDPLHRVYSFDLTVSAESVEALSVCLVSSINTGLGQLRSLFLFESTMESIKFGVTLYCITYIGCLCNLLTLVTLVWILLFSVPRLYTDNQTTLDSLVEKIMVHVEQVKTKMTGMVTKVVTVSPVKNIDEKMSPGKEE